MPQEKDEMLQLLTDAFEFVLMYCTDKTYSVNLL